MPPRIVLKLSTALAAAASLLVLAPIERALAATSFGNTPPYSASTTLVHQINYPRFLRFRVGAAGAGISAVNCNLSALATSLGNGASLPCTGGDLGAGASTVQIKSNAGQIRITATTTGALLSGANTLAYSEISTVTSSANLPAPVLPALGGTSAAVNVVLNAGNVTDRTATWTYAYANLAVHAPGTYGGVNVNNGRVTYTVSSP
ncbi:MAG TPA: hypothetical protein VN878_07860 [Usitatibacter sp.]|nr:hypothetical protein [Usitatibacter sp.]